MNPEAQRILEISSSWASVIGLPLALVGLGITIYQTVKTRKASVAAQMAVANFREDLGQTISLSELTKALTGIDELKRLLQNGHYKMLPDRFGEVRHLLIAVRGTAPQLQDHEESIFQDTIAELRMLEQKFVGFNRNSSYPKQIHKTTDALLKNTDDLHVIMTRLKEQIGEIKND